jgi:general secretion pathway protein G
MHQYLTEEETKMKAKRGFTLVEILIVVVILGILAAIVIPQFTQASSEAKLNSLCSDLQTLRSQIELYKVQHNDTPPDDDPNTFENQMIYTTTIGGTASTSKERTGNYQYGPYLERVPENPFTGSNSIVAWAYSGTDGGWAYNETTGEIKAAPDSTSDSDDHQTY